MYRTIGILIFGVLAAFAGMSAPASAADFSGRWATVEFGEMNVEQVRDRVDGTYAWNGGRVSGEVSGDWLSGIWAQSTSGRRCNREELGTFYWGRFKFQMSGDQTQWTGGWSYCDEPEASGGGWSGKRIGGVPSGSYNDGPTLDASFAGRWATAEFGEARLEDNNGLVSGSYAWKNGRISGSMNGNRLSGIWAQTTSGRRCNSQQTGSFYWGRFSWQLSSDATRWTGHWSYCDEPEGSGGGWNGTRIAGVQGGYADGPAAPTTFEGHWATLEFGEARFEERDGSVSGSYAWNGGQVSGNTNGNRLPGIWAQTTSGRRCNSQQLGTYYWGRMSLQLSTDGESWSGGWSYCDEADGSSGGWSGKRIRE